jgi:hypothetical protein
MTAPAPATALRTTRRWRRTAPFAAAGVLFVAYPVLRPWGDSDPATAGAAFASPLWLAAHLSAAVAFVLVGYGLLASRQWSRPALGLWWAGASLTLLYYGAETFALHALGAAVPDSAALAAMAEAIRMGPTQITVFGAGLVLMAAAAVVLAVRLRAVALPFALGMVLFLPQFFAGPELRIAHGVLLGAGCLLLAAVAGRRPADAP